MTKTIKSGVQFKTIKYGKTMADSIIEVTMRGKVIFRGERKEWWNKRVEIFDNA
jgi:hypothetical protein